MSENNWVAIFAQSGLGGLYIGVEEPYVEPEYVQCYDPDCDCGEGGSTPVRTTFFRLPDDIGEAELLDALEQGHTTGVIDDEYKGHMHYRGLHGLLTYLMKHDEYGVEYLPGRKMAEIKKRWDQEYLGPAKPRLTSAELDAAEEADHQEYLEDKARGGPASRFEERGD